MRNAVFLDRDGTINVDREFVYKVEDLEFLPGSVEGLLCMQRKDYVFIIITNQSGIGRGYYRIEDYKQLMKELYKRLRKEGIRIDADYYCPHSPEENCRCRKPKPALVERAVKEHNIDVKGSFFIGDKTADVMTGKLAGCKTILLRTGKAGKDGQYQVEPDYICADLKEACSKIK